MYKLSLISANYYKLYNIVHFLVKLIKIEKNYTDMKEGLARMHHRGTSGAVSFYIDKDLSKLIKLKEKERLRAFSEEEEKEELIIKKWE